MMYLGFSTWAMPDLPIEPVISHLATLGFDAVEICTLPRFTTALDTLDATARKRIPQLLREHNLKLSSVSSYLPMMEQDPEKFAFNRDYVKRTVDLADEWRDSSIPNGKPPVVVSGFGGKPGDIAIQELQLIERLNELGEYAASRNVTLAFEHHVGNAYETPDQVVALMQQVSSPAVKVNFDISHFNVMGYAIEESVDKLISYTAHTHVKDELGRAPEHQYLIPGEGEFDYVRYLQAMQAHGYSGAISTEISMMVQRRPDYDALATATRSYEVLSRAFADADIARRS
ncbi:MAG TPA: sugar phosphate isomerase/epimerase [Caldilineaceae bacterium]|nr:sugar phosphate isomerase/epimerase [Caldilineaceae bacterium]